jgi:hypothetical protein
MTMTHLPLAHCVSFVQWQLCPVALHDPACALQPPAVQAAIGIDVAQPAVTLAQAPLHRTKPLPQTNVHAPATHAACPLAMPVVHALPHSAQSLVLLVVSTQVPEHTVAAVDGHVAVHA